MKIKKFQTHTPCKYTDKITCNLENNLQWNIYIATSADAKMELVYINKMLCFTLKTNIKIILYYELIIIKIPVEMSNKHYI